MPRYSKEFIGEIKTRLRVSDVVGKFVKLTQRGNEAGEKKWTIMIPNAQVN